MAASPRVSIVLDLPRSELLQDGFGESKTASAAKAGKWSNKLWQEGALPEGIWKEPTTGCLMLKPSVFRADVEIEEKWGENRALIKEAFDFANEQQVHVEDNPVYPTGVLASVQTIAPKRSGTGSTLINLLTSAALVSIASAMEMSMVWWAATKLPLKRNEGFAIIVNPANLALDTTLSYMNLAFGGKFFLDLKAAGEFALYYNDGDDSDPAWRMISRQSYKNGSVDHTSPFQITVIPWGPDYFSLHFSQIAQGVSGKSRAVGERKSESAFLISLSRAGIECPWADDIGQYIKTTAAKLHIALPAKAHTGRFHIKRVAYAEETVDLGPLTMPEPKGQKPDVFGYGYWDYENSRPDAPKLALEVIPDHDGDWSDEEDYRGAVRVVMTPSPDQIYTPELWSYDVTVPAMTHVPNWTPRDVSDKFTWLRLQLTARSEASVCQAKLIDQDPARMYHRGGPITVSFLGIDGQQVTVFDGYIKDREPTPFGPAIEGSVVGKMREEVTAHDMWTRVDNLLLSRSVSVDGMSIAELIRMVLNRCGFADEDIDVEDDVLEELTLAGSGAPDDLRVFNADATAGDVIRDIQKYTSAQFSDALRVRWEDGRWRVYLAWSFNVATDPFSVFFLDTSVLEDWDTFYGSAISLMGDQDRWESKFYKVTSSVEPNITQPAFNRLEVVAKVGDPSSDTAALVVIDPHPDVLNNPESPYFEGCVRTEVMAPPETVGAGDIERIQAWARSVYDREQLKGITLGFQAEWQPEIKPDQHILVIGRAPDGSPCSYGYFRIEEIDVEVTGDANNEEFRTDWGWSGSYSLVFQSRSGEETFPMIGTPPIPAPEEPEA